MKIRQHKLRIVRRVVGYTTLVLFVLYFVTRGRGSDIFAPLAFMAHIQFTPALLSATAQTHLAYFVALMVVVLLLSRIYCSVICPLGIFQDLFIRWNKKKRMVVKRKFTHTKLHSIIRYTILAAVLVSYFIGFEALGAWLDPYSNFGRIASNLLRPVAYLFNNLAASIFSGSISQVNFNSLTPWVMIFPAVLTVALILINTFYGRFYCNVICPVGTLLGLMSKISLFRVRIDKSRCVSCGLCGRACKSSCIDVKKKKVDNTRCVHCYSCLSVDCKVSSINLELALLKKHRQGDAPNAEATQAATNEPQATT
jgi:polyferredoxin